MNLKQIVETADTPAGKVFDIVIEVLIVVSLVGFSLETLPNLSEETQDWLYVVEIFTVIVFSIEYGLRVMVADRPLRYIFTMYALIDLIAILPFYLSTGIDLRSVRVLRLFRAFRVFKFTRYTEAMDRIREAFNDIRSELYLYLMATGLFVYLASVGMYYFESEAQPEDFGSIFHCLWWAIITLTTIGYGDVVPVTVGGRVFTGLLVVLGIGTVAVPSGLFASALTKTARSDGPSPDG